MATNAARSGRSASKTAGVPVLNLASLGVVLCCLAGPLAGLVVARHAEASWIGHVICCVLGLVGGFVGGMCSLALGDRMLGQGTARSTATEVVCFMGYFLVAPVSVAVAVLLSVVLAHWALALGA